MIKPIPEFEEHYTSSDKGEVYSLRHDRILKPGRYGNGYRSVCLHKNGNPYNRTIHSLVMLAFVGPKPPGQVILHADDDKTNNCLNNLSYGTQRKNLHDSVVTKLSDEDVYYAGFLRSFGVRAVHIAEELSVTAKTIRARIRQQTLLCRDGFYTST